jgi:hypothetical protein
LACAEKIERAGRAQPGQPTGGAQPERKMPRHAHLVFRKPEAGPEQEALSYLSPTTWMIMQSRVSMGSDFFPERLVFSDAMSFGSIIG